MTRAQQILLVTLAVSWYNVAVIWLMQILIYPSWAFIPTADFGHAQGYHFVRLFIVVFPQAALATLGALALLRWRPPGIPKAALWLGLGIQLSLWLLTALLWGRWQGQIALGDAPPGSLGPANVELYHLLVTTHWLRVALITAYGILVFWMAYRSFRQRGAAEIDAGSAALGRGELRPTGS